MNIIDWHRENLDYRCIMFQCYMNIYGQTEDVDIMLEVKRGSQQIVRVSRINGENLVIYLHTVFPLTDCLYNFSLDDGTNGTLVIPKETEFEEEEE